MKKELTSITPLRAGIVLGAIYGCIALIIVPFVLLFSLFGSKGGISVALFVLLLPVLYAIFGFIGGVISAALYNLIAKYTGGIEFEVRDVTPPAA